MARSIASRRLSSSFVSPIEQLEQRRMLCAPGELVPQYVELRPDLVQAARKAAGLAKGGKGTMAPATAGPAADIIWVNRGQSSDGFDSTFGTMAPTARAVVDAVITMYERMIGSFNYGDGSANFNLTLSMSGGGFGAGAGSGSTVGGKPKSGSITMGKGNNVTLQAGQGSDQGWFLDPTPFDNSEFMGAVQSAYAANATSGGPASGKGDFLTVVEAEMTHEMGQFGNINALWNAMTTSVGTPDQAHAGTLYVFRGPSIKHLLTSDNGGGASSYAGVHTADPQAAVTFQGDTYSSTDDQGNAFYENSRRYLVDNMHALMFKDAFAYSTVDPAQFGTMYNVLNQTTGAVTVRGGDAVTNRTNSNDVITITRSGSTITISEDIGNDVAASGSFPGEGNLPAFVTQYDISQVNSITINSGDGNDTITIGTNIGVPISINAGTGTDSVTIQGTTSSDNVTIGNGTIGGDLSVTSLASVENLIVNTDAGDDNITLTSGANVNSIDAGAGTNDTISIAGSSNADIINVAASTIGGAASVGSFSNVENVAINAGDGNDVLSFNATGATFALSVNGQNNDDTLTVTGGSNTVINFAGGSGNNTLNVNSGSFIANGDFSSGGGTMTVNVNNAASLSMTTSQHLSAINVDGAGSQASMSTNGGNVLVTQSLSLTNGGNLDLNDNDMLLDYTGASQLGAVVGLISAARNGGAWNGTGLDSSAAAASGGLTSLAAVESADYKSIYGGNATFDGQQLDNDAIVIKYTYYGDSDLNGKVDGADYARVDAAFNQEATNHSNIAGWFNGDFDYNGKSDGADYALIDAAFNAQLGVL